MRKIFGWIAAVVLLNVLPAVGQTPLRFHVYGAVGETDPLAPSIGEFGLGSHAGEPSVGANHNSGNLMFIAFLETIRLAPDHCSSPPVVSWSNRSYTTTAVDSLDPILFTDHTTGRTFASQLAGKCSAMVWSDDDGATWTQSQGCGINSGVDHQTVGAGPFPASDPLGGVGGYAHATYYCSQDDVMAQCALSRDGGQTFGPAVPIYTQAECDEVAGKLHGHVKVAPDGTAYVPAPTCSGKQIVSVSEDAGLTWTVRPIPDSSGSQGSDPAVYADAANKIYFAYVDGDGKAKVATSVDHGETWSASVSIMPPGVELAAFPQTIAGDAGRVAVAFLGSSNPDLGSAFGTDTTAPHTWYMYVAMTYDGGATWEKLDLAPSDPVQRGCICMQGTLCAGGRNLLDFNEIDVTADGRVVVGYADGCIRGCLSGPPNSGTDVARVAIQTGGKRLYAAFDPGPAAPPAAPYVTGSIASGDVTLLWSEPESGSAITAYDVYRKLNVEGSFSPLATLSPAAFAYFDHPTSVLPGFDARATEYRVTAVNAGGGEGANCHDVTLTPPLSSDTCNPPGVLVASDSFDAVAPATTSHDGEAVYVQEPAGPSKLVFTIKVKDLTTPVPPGFWIVMWNRPVPDAGADRNYVAMRSTGATTSFEYGQISPPSANAPTMVGPAVGSIDAVAERIRIEIDPALVDGVGAGDSLPGLELRTFVSPAPPVVSQASATDFSGAGTYDLVGNGYCAPNGLPVAVADSAFTDPGAAKEVDVLANDSDPNADPLQLAVVFQPAHGVTQKTPDQKVLYQPANGFTGGDSFNYKIADGRGGEAIGTVSMTVQDLPNFPPRAEADEASVEGGRMVSIDVLSNDTDADNDALTIASVTQPGACGSPLIDASSNRINFFADSAFLGGCCFNYVVQDGNGGSDFTEVCVQVTCPPVPTGDLVFDFESGAQGFTVDHHLTDTGSIDWALETDPTSPLDHVWFTNDPAAIGALGTKDDRLISPPIDVSSTTELQFEHRFSTEDTFDGGGLEVSLDGGANWQFVPATAFLAGGYNSTATGFPAAWSGVSASYPAMDLVRVNMSGYAGDDRLVRWRMLADTNNGVEGWYVDDVHFTHTLEPGTCSPFPVCDPGGALCYHTVTPCRLLDTRVAGQGGPLATAQGERTLAIVGSCGVPASAKAVAVNITAVNPTAEGFLTFAPENPGASGTSNVNFGPAQTRANNAVLSLFKTGTVQVNPFVANGGQVDLVLDVVGYFD